MKRIIIIGSSGAGKSTLAKKLSQKMGLPLIGLDQHYWRSNWQATPSEEWRKKLTGLVKQDKWIIEGNYLSTFDIKFPVCDAVIVLDINRFVCFYRIWKRHILRNRPDKLDCCREKMDLKLMKWVLWGYPRKGRREVGKYLQKYQNKRIIIIKSTKELKNFETKFDLKTY